MHHSLVSILRWRAAHQPEQRGYSFLGDGETLELDLTYAQLDQRARTIAALLQQAEATGARAMLLYPPGPDYLAAFFGCLYAGVVAIPAYPPRQGQLHRNLARLQAITKDARPLIGLTTSSIVSAVASLSDPDPSFGNLRWLATDLLDDHLTDQWVLPTIDQDTIALLQYTSGSTAAPKGVVLRHGNLLHNSAQIQRCFDHTAESCGVIWLPPYHDMGLIGGIIQPLYAGFPVVLMPPVAFLQRPARWLEAVSRYGATTSGGPNFAYDLCVRKIPVEQRATLDLSRWRVAFTGAEPVRAETLARFTEAFEPCGFRREAFYPCYGLAEATLIVSGGATDEPPVLEAFESVALRENRVVVAAASDRQQQTLVGCGKSVTDQQIVIVQPETLTRCAPGEVGEIWVSGASVAAGYWERAAETAQTFGAYLADTGAGPFLRTGDLGFMHDGELFITGRCKDLIIIRGRNHYPQDIELTAEQSHPALRPGCGAAFTVEIADEERLVVVQEVERQHRMSVDIDAVAGAIRRSVAAEHDVQVYAVALIRPGSIPKTSSGKIQRQLCRAKWLSQDLDVIGDSLLEAAQAEIVIESLTAEALRELAPDEQRRALEAYLLARIAGVVGVGLSELDPEQPISALGIDSLAAVEVQYQLETDLGIAVPMVLFLKDLSIAELAAEILTYLVASAGPAGLNQASGAASGEPSPLTYGQRALWFLHQLAPESGTYNIVAAVQIGADLDLAALERAFQRLVDRHPALRTTFGSINGEPFQRVQEQISVQFEDIDAREWSEATLNERLVAAAYAPFDLARDPLLRVRLYQRPDQTRILLLAIHHIIADFWSLGVFTRELDLIYRAEQAGQTAPLHRVPSGHGTRLAVSYIDYTRREAELLASAAGERLWHYWQAQLDPEGTPATTVLNLPTDYPRPPIQTYRGATHTFALSPALSREIKALTHTAGTTLYTTLLAAFQVLLYRYTGQDDLVVGSPSAGRSHADVAGLIGYFVNPVALRARLAGNPAFLSFLAQVRQTVLAALEHQAYPLPLLVERLDLARLPDRSPLFQVMFLVQKAAGPSDVGLTKLALGVPGASLTIGGVPIRLFPLEQRVARFDLMLTMADIGDELVGALEYNTDLFAATTIERMVGHLQTLLQAITTNPEQPIAYLPLLTETEQQLFNTWNATTHAYPEDHCLHTLFAAQALRTPDATALIVGSERVSYAELARRSTALAEVLQAAGVTAPEVPVGICLDRSTELLVALLAVLTAGGCYLPLDPAYPAERIQFMLEDTQAAVLLTTRPLLHPEGTRLPTTARVICLDEPLPDRSSPLRAPTVTPDHLAYLIYTSGSTGRPKGVAITHRSAVAMLTWAETIFSPADLAGTLAATSICFDLSIFELFLPLACGGTVILADHALALPQLPAADEVTLINTVPSAMAALLRSGGLPASVRTVNLAGEPLQNALAQQVYQQRSVERVFNLYGPSEDTTYSTWELVERGSLAEPTIGRPIANTQCYILDRAMQQVPIGVVGELFLGGDGLARGYLNRPELTAELFLPNAFSQNHGSRLYRTGDLARWLPDGRIAYLGRIDHQVKLRGFRIELGEIEAVLGQHPAIAECVVLPHGERLVAYVVENKEQRAEQTKNKEQRTKESNEPDSCSLFSVLCSSARSALPDYMIPSAFVFLDALPKTPNGKIDRKALPAPDQPPVDTAFVAPRTPTEEIIAEIWAEVLGRDQIGIHDTFFALGGHSLLAVQALSRLNDTFQIAIPLHTLFNMPTIAALGVVVEDELLQKLEGLTDEQVLQLTQSFGEDDRL